MIAKRRCAIAVAAIFGSVISTVSLAAESVRTALDLDKCHHTRGSAEEDYGAWLCKGYADIAVHVTAGDQRSYVSYGKNAKAEPAAAQTLAAMNSPGKIIEWRSDRAANGKLKPFATIVSWNMTLASDAEPERGKMLVVTRLAPGPICQMGYVDALANANADALAQTIADEHARQFRCGSDQPVVLGNKGAGFSLP